MRTLQHRWRLIAGRAVKLHDEHMDESGDDHNGWALLALVILGAFCLAVLHLG